MNARALFTLIPLALLSVGCGSSDDTDPASGGPIFEVPGPGPNGVQLISPTFEVKPGTETFMCYRFPFEVTEDLFVQSSKGYQAPGGHHSLLYYVEGTTPIPEEPHECLGADMGNIRFVGVGTGYGKGIELPQGKALKIPKGVKIYAQSHYLNSKNAALTAQDVVNLELIPADQVEAQMGSYAPVDLGLELPARDITTRKIECHPPVNMTIPWMFPHMHEWGSHASLEVIKDGVKQTIWDGEWSSALRDDFPLVTLPDLTLTPNDTIITTCTWENTTDETIFFPKEMCASFMVFSPSDDGALWACNENGDNFVP